jgi:hypothetical protein
MHTETFSYPTPLFYGRLARVLAGFITFGVVLFLGQENLGSWGFWGLICLGVSFFIAGMFAVPGCEITAIPNLFLSRRRQIHCFCPVFSPLDKIEQSRQATDTEAVEPE